MTKIGVVLSGCGVMDGSEINEAVLTLLAIDQQGASYQCLAPNRDQHHVINHISQQEMPERRNIMVEAARIARGEILDLSLAKATDYDAIIFPGGFGAAKNLCDFAFKGRDAKAIPEVVNFVQECIKHKIPAGFICIAPAMIPMLYPKGTKVTIGNDKDAAAHIQAMGGQHIDCGVSTIVSDEAAFVVSTPAYMLANRISEAFEGIEALVKQLIIFTKTRC